MTSPRVDAFVAEMKLRSLREARDRLAAAYDAVEARAAAAAEPREALRALSRGLAELKVGERHVHPDVGNLEVVCASGEPDLVGRWLSRLHTALRQGRARADVLPLFGGVVAEWARPREAPRGPAEAEGLAGWLAPPGPTPPLLAALESRIDPAELGRARAIARRRSAKLFSPDAVTALDRPLDVLTEEARADAERLFAERRRSDEGGPPPELDAALRLAWEQIEHFDWPEAGVTLAPLWARTRFRLRPQIDYVTACLVESIGASLDEAIGAVSGRARLTRLLRSLRLKELKAPEIILRNEELLLKDTADLFGWVPADLGGPDSAQRARQGCRGLSPDGDYAYDGSNQIGTAFAFIEAELGLARAHGEPRYVLKTDIKDFYPSVSHGLVRDLLAWLGVDPRAVDLAARVLSVRLPGGARTTRGLPLGLALSRAVGELLVTILEAEMRAAAPVDVVSMVDDVVCVARSPRDLHAAWAALGRAAFAMGLELRADKTGAVALNGALPRGVPNGPVRWGMLRLSPEGFRLDEEAHGAFVATSIRHIDAQPTLLDRVVAFRGQLRYLWGWLAPTAKLGPQHLDVVEEGLRRFVEPVGMKARLRRELSELFLGGAPALAPDAWLHWPITAGGLALPYPAADLVPLRLALEKTPPTPPPAPIADPERKLDDDPAWGAWYAEQLAPIAPAEPAKAEAIDALVKRFVERGAKVGQQKTELSAYWRWVLQSLGPDILDAYGTFDFLPTDLVPVGVLRRAVRGGAGS